MIYIKPPTYIVMALLPCKKKKKLLWLKTFVCLTLEAYSFFIWGSAAPQQWIPNKAKRVPVVAVLDVADQM